MDGGDERQQARTRAQELVDDLRSELESIIWAQESDPPDDEHDVEGSSIAFERERVKALLALAESRLAVLDDVGAHASSRDWRTCESCGEPIGDERMEAVPGTRRCVRCATPTARRLRARRTGG